MLKLVGLFGLFEVNYSSLFYKIPMSIFMTITNNFTDCAIYWQTDLLFTFKMYKLREI